MTGIKRRRVARNEICWLVEGVGAHGAVPRSADEVAASLKGRFAFVEETTDEPGLRSPQLGALHAILAHHSMETNEPITIVMPSRCSRTRSFSRRWLEGWTPWGTKFCLRTRGRRLVRA